MAYRAEVRIVTEPEIKQANRDGREFAVCRAVVSRNVFDRDLGANIRQDTYLGLVALDQHAESLMGCTIGSRVIVEGELYWDDWFNKETGRSGRDRKCQVSGLYAPSPAPANGVVESEYPGYLASLVQSGR